MSEAAPVTYLLYQDALTIDTAAVIKALRHFHPELCKDAAVIKSLWGSGSKPRFSVGGRVVAVDSRPAPLSSERWHAIAANGCNWSTAVETCSRHRAHISVTIEGAPRGKLADARLNAAFAGAVAIAHQNLPLAALWHDGISVLNAGSTFTELAIKASKASPDIPAVLWVTMLPLTEDKTQTAIVFTVGLGRFGHLELEFEAPVKHTKLLWEQCQNVIGYLVEHEGERLQNGAMFAIPGVCSYIVGLQASTRFNGVGVYKARLDVIESSEESNTV